jgi:hypothetical protein
MIIFARLEEKEKENRALSKNKSFLKQKCRYKEKPEKVRK